MRLKRFTQFVKKINEDLNPDEEFDNVEDFKKEIGDSEELSEDDYDFEDDEDDMNHMDDMDDHMDHMHGDDMEDDMEDDMDYDMEDDMEYQEEEEEEVGEYIGTKMLKDLASRLGVEVENNEINYKGQKINFFSETEKFHIGRNKFSTIEEVVDFLESENMGGMQRNKRVSPRMEREEPLSERRRFRRF